jgi:hypothetical protein
MRAAVCLLIAASLAAGAAAGEPAVAPTQPAQPSGKTVDGLTVVAPTVPTKECSPRDQQCVRLVVAELKRLYPEQLKRFCFQRQMRAMRSNLLNDTDPSQPAFTSMFSAPPAMKLACSSDKH